MYFFESWNGTSRRAYQKVHHSQVCLGWEIKHQRRTCSLSRVHRLLPWLSLTVWRYGVPRVFLLSLADDGHRTRVFLPSELLRTNDSFGQASHLRSRRILSKDTQEWKKNIPRLTVPTVFQPTCGAFIVPYPALRGQFARCDACGTNAPPARKPNTPGRTASRTRLKRNFQYSPEERVEKLP